MKIIIASQNQGKILEFHKLLSPFNLEILSLNDFPEIDEIEETGTTFEANARLKAETIAKQLGCLTLADDSGLVVEDLNGAPGVFSARYSGEPKDDCRNNQKLLIELAKLPSSGRDAKFVSCIVVAHPHHESLVVFGEVEGKILNEARGDSGFGYDPLFYYPPLAQTFAELSLDQKNSVSHRGRAINKLLKELPMWMKELDRE